ncbi:hypothetical protein B4N89_27435 [Embleya scabrispora]|uniref:Uncharacterized protein n=1 Tax=Embleya scabrispora TaxID=159449 RepID=A0A1T3P5C4_9ACTN|nr:hypothetical protein [Embleya scabrispora]OPC84161.1 hypothetical protein B4N89_27435 [Embleya scabrispora]
MTDQPYTQEDLLAEATRRRRDRTTWDLVDTVIPSTGLSWAHLCTKDYSIADEEIRRLVRGAPDLSEWAVAMGGDGLQPSTHTLSLLGDGKHPFGRLHFAFEADMPEDARRALIVLVGEALQDALAQRVPTRLTTHGRSPADNLTEPQPMPDPEPPADTIRRAADLMRTRAAAATRGPWLSMDGGDRLVHDPGHDYDPPEYVVDEPMSSAANAEHIAALHPLVAVAMANVLEQLARSIDECDFYGTPASALALELAYTYLGREA